MSKEKNLDRDIDLKSYDDPTGVSLKEMNFGLWLSENRHKFLRAVTVSLIVLCVFLFIYFSYNLIIYFLTDDLSVTTDIPMSPRELTQEITVAQLSVLPSGERYDYAADLKNANDKFMASFRYCFTSAGKDAACGSSFILPGEEKYVLALGQALPEDRSAMALRIYDIFWQRINAHNIPDWKAYYQSRLNFPVTDISFKSGGENEQTEKIDLSAVTFNIGNSTAFGYYDVPLDILLFSGNELVGVNRYDLQNFKAGESRTVKLSWPGRIPSVDRTEVRPDLNITAEDQYLKYQGETGN